LGSRLADLNDQFFDLVEQLRLTQLALSSGHRMVGSRLLPLALDLAGGAPVPCNLVA
jgi:hypothetical protein